jgi:hypothetical protein
MTPASDPLADEVKAIRRGRGLHHAAIEARVGPMLRRACGVLPGDPPPVVRTKVIERLGNAAEGLPRELSLAARAALGIHPDTYELLQLQDRVEWLARQLRRDVRTARRRIDEACVRLAERLAASTAGPTRGRRGPGWYVSDFHLVVLLDGDEPVTIERREIVAEWDGLDEIMLAWSLRATDSPAGSLTDLGLRPLYGGQLAQPEEASGSRMQVALRLPRPLRATERHEYGVLTRLPSTVAMQRHYAYTPATRCDHFHLRVRFDAERAPERIWRVADAFHRDLDERTTEGESLQLDRCGDLELEFEELLPGHGYGLQWD